MKATVFVQGVIVVVVVVFVFVFVFVRLSCCYPWSCSCHSSCCIFVFPYSEFNPYWPVTLVTKDALLDANQGSCLGQKFSPQHWAKIAWKNRVYINQTLLDIASGICGIAGSPILTGLKYCVILKPAFSTRILLTRTKTSSDFEIQNCQTKPKGVTIEMPTTRVSVIHSTNCAACVSTEVSSFIFLQLYV